MNFQVCKVLLKRLGEHVINSTIRILTITRRYTVNNGLKKWLIWQKGSNPSKRYCYQVKLATKMFSVLIVKIRYSWLLSIQIDVMLSQVSLQHFDFYLCSAVFTTNLHGIGLTSKNFGNWFHRLTNFKRLSLQWLIR